MKCKHCKSGNTVKNGFVRGKQRYLCNDCKRTFTVGDKRSVKSSGKLIFDILCSVDETDFDEKAEFLTDMSKHFGVSRRTIKHWIDCKEANEQIDGTLKEVGNINQVKRYIDREKYFLFAEINLDNKANAIIIVQEKR
jgi:transposase-like protein